MHLSTAPYEERCAEEWDDFVQHHSRNGVIFHERKFLGYHLPSRFRDRSLLFRRDAQLVGVMPAADVIESDGCRAVVSHPGSSAGGVVFHRQATLREVLEMVEESLAYYRLGGANALELRLPEPIFSDPVEGELPFVLWHRGFKLRTREVSSCVPLNSASSWIEFGRDKNPGTIRALRKTGVVVDMTRDAEFVYSLIERNLDRRYQKHPTHSRSEFLDLKRRYPERIDYWVARVGETAVATCVLFQANKNAVHDFYIALDYAYAKLNVMPFLFYTVFEHYRAAGFRWFNFGISSRADWIKWGILEFKERLGGRATVRDVWRLDELANHERYQEKVIT